MLQEGLRVTLLLLEGVALEVRDLDLFMFHSHTVPRPRSLMTPGDGPQRPLAAKPSRGNGPHTCRRPAQPRVAAHPDRPRP